MAKNKTLSDEIMNEVITALYKTKSLAQTLREKNIQVEDFYQTLRTVPLHAQDYARAQDARADLFADEIIEIADYEEDHNKARNRINARMWATSKMKPQVYGDRIDVNVNQTIDIRGALDEAKNRIKDIIQLPSLQVIDSTTAISRTAPGCQPENPTENDVILAEIDDLLK